MTSRRWPQRWSSWTSGCWRPFHPSCPSKTPQCPLSQLWLPDGREWKASWRTNVGLQPQHSPWPVCRPLTPSWAFEEDIYKPLAWQQCKVRLFYLPDLSWVTTKEASCSDGLTERGLIKPIPLQSVAMFPPVGHGWVRCSETVIKKLSDLISDFHWAPIREELQAYYLQATSDKCPTRSLLESCGGPAAIQHLEGQISVSLGVRLLSERQCSITKHLFQLSEWEQRRALQENRYWGPEVKHKSSDLSKLKPLSERKKTFLFSFFNLCINKIQTHITDFCKVNNLI